MDPEHIIAIARRENNTKRKFLVVNKEQGKHVPVSPDKPLHMFSALADLTAERYQKERLLLIGFAETATAIGETLAVQLDADYMQTTREDIPGVDYLHFCESHSHAVCQKVVRNDLDLVIDSIDRIVFVEDEVTTGNTIEKIVNLIRQTYGRKLKFSAVSLLNGMDEEARKRYRDRQIELIYLAKTDHSGYSETAEKYHNDGIYHKSILQARSCRSDESERINAGRTEKVFAHVNAVRTEKPGASGCINGTIEEFRISGCVNGTIEEPGALGCINGTIEELRISGCINARRLHKGQEYQSACERLWQALRDKIPFGTDRDILVLGTEEFMYAPLYAAEKIREMGNRVTYHATTRSPIMVSREPEYPLHERYELASFYDRERTTYVYDLEAYDLALILTDAQSKEVPAACSLSGDSGAVSLCSALCGCGNREIYVVRWCED